MVSLVKLDREIIRKQTDMPPWEEVVPILPLKEHLLLYNPYIEIFSNLNFLYFAHQITLSKSHRRKSMNINSNNINIKFNDIQ